MPMLTKNDYNMFMPVCHKCGGKSIIRRNYKKGIDFYGCENYPECDWTLPAHTYNNKNKKKDDIEQISHPDDDGHNYGWGLMFPPFF